MEEITLTAEDLIQEAWDFLKQSTYSAVDFLKRLVKWYDCRGIRGEYIQTDNGSEFTNHFLAGKQNCPTSFEVATAKLDIRYKLVRHYTP